MRLLSKTVAGLRPPGTLSRRAPSLIPPFLAPLTILSVVEPTEVERRLIESAQSGVLLHLSTDQASDVRAVVIRDLLRGKYTDQPDPRGVRLRGARILGELDLADVRTEIPLTLQDCSHDEPLSLTRAHLPHLDLSGSTFPALEAADFVCEHDLQLSNVRSQRLHLVGANVSGQVNLTDARLCASSTPALNSERITIGNGLFLTDSVGSSSSTRGTFCFLGATVAGPFELDGTRLQCANGPALNADWLTVTGSMFLNEGFTAGSDCERGTIRFQGVSVTGQLNLNDASLSNSTNDGPGLVVIGARIGSDLVLPTRALDNSGHRSVLVSLNGLQYPFVPRRATHREWLTLLAQHAPAYAAQPYQQLAAVHRAAGHERESREILIAQQRDFRKRGELGGGRKLLHLASGVLRTRRGHRPPTAQDRRCETLRVRHHHASRAGLLRHQLHPAHAGLGLRHPVRRRIYRARPQNHLNP